MRRVVVLLLCTLVVGVPTGALAGQGVHDLRGHFAGYFRSLGTPDTQGPFSIDVSSQSGRRFSGEVCLPPGPCTPVQGTLADSGEITMTGRNSQARSLVLHGRVNERAALNPCVLVGDYRVERTDGSRDQGQVVAVHQVADHDPPSDLNGRWSGNARSVGNPDLVPVDTSFSLDRQGAMVGSFSWGTHDPPLDRTNLVGQSFSTSDGSDGIMLIGLLHDALVAADLDLSRSRDGSRLQGTYQMLSDGGTDQGSLMLLPAV